MGRQDQIVPDWREGKVERMQCVQSHFVQPGRVRLYYDEVKANEVIWTQYRVDSNLPDCPFSLPNRDECSGPFDLDRADP